MSILAALLGFNVLILVHELGHFLVARLSGMRVHRFSIGFGPPLLVFRGRETRYQLALFPLGGYVQVSGLGPRRDEHGRGSFQGARPWQRGLMVAAGPAANFLLAAALYLYLFASFNALSFGFSRIRTTTLRAVTGPAAAAGLLPFDTITQIAIDGEPPRRMRTFEDILRIVGASEGRPLWVDVARPPSGVRPPLALQPYPDVPGLMVGWPSPAEGTAARRFAITPEVAKSGRYVIGISPDLARFGTEAPARALSLAFRESWAVTRRMLEGLRDILTGEQEAEVSSPVKITQIGADTVKLGLGDWFLNFMALVSLNLFLVNLLPLPALDGGRLVFIGLEIVSRRPVPRKVEAIVHGVGLLLLLGFILVVTVGDIVSLF